MAEKGANRAGGTRGMKQDEHKKTPHYVAHNAAIMIYSIAIE
ncbi:hypothetical protein PEC311524_08480 [Pectobacterium carotovorum subsp. carotovorum]|nr:hypothetical protein PEC311524_08480 [Pectobacterium carotovorum subsp. carotovorum]